jgi:NADP-dependent 3-hydroxy acid dehydrogenase YdfG
MQRLTGKVAWVTGAGTGIGEAAAIALAREGASVMLTGRRKEPLEMVAARVAEEGGTARVHSGDMSRAEDALGIAEAIEREFGRIDILVNNAGSNIPDRSWKRLSPSGVDELIRSNLSSSFHGALAVLPIMRNQKDGVIINTASIAGRVVSTQPGAGYIAAKHGVVALSHNINMERSAGMGSARRRSVRVRSRRRSSPNAPSLSARRTGLGCCNRRISAI